MSHDEFVGILSSMGDPNRPVMSKPPRVAASRDFIREVRDELALTDEHAERAADWIANKLERYAAYFARPVMSLDGLGPQCSLCEAPWPLCGHHHLSGWDDTDEDGDDA
ncbi:hypothetical protein DW322_08740 [Rhodococcus rhodnii]|uniref:Uncharacterized protein n=2 Tax=Rhodococcus rhodnii TaxID=38312 RepID=R7WRI6_9NOCA|nr:hypothetical protein [Rhodococcus rhodnii]EOM77928.1 hypothetical protein Rrhod_0737 [Rhodococcus rhodnii LMG 5362]TXG90294.1 hypothetical protein DW322_08740 [Rhodococcus rhodnii]